MAENSLEVADLVVRYGDLIAVNGVSFVLHRGETLGIVGESGSGKSTIARAITGLVKPVSGSIVTCDRIGMVFQDPLGSLNPRQTVRQIVGRNCERLLTEVGMPVSAANRYPHEFSGGERQRISIARSLAFKPNLLICDEAVSALDLSIRSRMLDLFGELKTKHDLSLLFITHDIGVVQHIADRVLVMRKGKIVESGETDAVLHSPQSEYTKELIAAVPRLPQ